MRCTVIVANGHTVRIAHVCCCERQQVFCYTLACSVEKDAFLAAISRSLLPPHSNV